MAEPIKRQRLKLDVTNTDSWKNRSLFMETLGRGSGDTLPLIFKQLSSLKDKIRLEGVCKLFQKHGRSIEAWSNVVCISISVSMAEVDEEDDCYRINEDFVPDTLISQSIRAIFSRSRKLKKLELHLSCELSLLPAFAYESMVESILQQGDTDALKNLKELQLDAYCCPEGVCTCYILEDAKCWEDTVQLINMFKKQLTTLKLHGYCDCITMPWIQIGECANLTSIFIDGTLQEDEIAMVKKALCGKNIQKLGLGDCCTEADELVEIVSSLAYHSPRILTFKDEFYTLADFVSKLPAVQWNSIEEIRYIHEFRLPHFDADWSIILQLPRISPNLQKLVLHTRRKHSQAIELVMSYLKILNESVPNRSLTMVHDLNLLGGGWTTVLKMLANKKHNCEIVRIGKKTHRVRCLQLGQSTIELYEQ